MNLMILSPGRRVDIVEYFKKEFHVNKGFVYTLDITKYSSALYYGDDYFVIEKDFSNLDKYINKVIDICISKKVDAVITLIDPELELLAKNKAKFESNGIIPIVSDLETISLTFDKYIFFEKLRDSFPVVPTWKSVHDCLLAINNREVCFPIFAKIRNGSGSVGICKVEDLNALKSYSSFDNYVFQPYLLKNEYGMDMYFDMISGKLVSYFIKKKINMRSGETDKSISIKNRELENLALKLTSFNFRGPIDMDIFEDSDGNFIINEINPRIGGGYPHAYNCGVNFMKKIVNNLNGIENIVELGAYEENIVMMKYNSALYMKQIQDRLVPEEKEFVCQKL